MGNVCIVIRSVGIHHNGLSGDAEQIAKRCVDELKANGHTVLSAHVESGGSLDLLNPQGGLRGYDAHVDGGTVPTKVDSWKLRDPETPGRMAYERYLHRSGGKSLVSGAELPGWEGLAPEIREAWMAAADPSAPRLTR